jgi:hypothetical protein
MNKYILVLSLILICGCLESTTTVDGKPVKVINDRNGKPYVVQFIDQNSGKVLYSKNINTDPSLENKIVYNSQIPYMYIGVSILVIIVIYIVLKIWKLGKDEGE